MGIAGSSLFGKSPAPTELGIPLACRLDAGVIGAGGLGVPPNEGVSD